MANASRSTAFPSRSDFTSVPASARPASTRSRMWYSCRARRFETTVCSPSATRGVYERGPSAARRPAHRRARVAARTAPGRERRPWPLLALRASQVERDPAAELLDVRDHDAQRIPQAEARAAAPSDERRLEVVRVEALAAAQPPRRQEALEDAAEAHEQPGPDEADHLAVVL